MTFLHCSWFNFFKKKKSGSNYVYLPFLKIRKVGSYGNSFFHKFLYKLCIIKSSVKYKSRKQTTTRKSIEFKARIQNHRMWYAALEGTEYMKYFQMRHFLQFPSKIFKYFDSTFQRILSYCLLIFLYYISNAIFSKKREITTWRNILILSTFINRLRFLLQQLFRKVCAIP